MELDAQKSFAQMHEDRNMNKGIGGQVVKLDPVVTQKAQRRKPNMGASIPVQSKGQKLRFRLYFHTDDLHPRQDAIG